MPKPPSAPPATQRRVIFTGHPPPAVQVRDQIRSPTGVTYARRVLAFASATPKLATKPSLAFAIRLMSFLQTIEDSGDPLPDPAEIALYIDDAWHAETVIACLKNLQSSGDITLWIGARNWSGHFGVRLPAGSRPLLTAGAPRRAASWF